MIAVDTSVVVAAFGPWHEHHAEARSAVSRRAQLPSHCGVEAFATLTRLPDPFRAPADVVGEFLERRFGDRWLFPDPTDIRGLPARLAALGISGGATYDALVAVTVIGKGGTLRTLDRRAERIYQAIGVDYELLVP